jgi:hypothetical protein
MIALEIGVGEKSNLHAGRVVRISSRARISFSRKLGGSGSELRLPAAHFPAWLTR